MSLPLALPLVVLLALVVAALAGCGSDRGDRTTGSSGAATTVALPPLARRAAAAGEIVVRGETSPDTHGPYAFDGRYLVRFEQYAPEDPNLDYTSQTPFTAALTRRQGDARREAKLFQAAARSGHRELEIRGRYDVDVTFGDYPYVIRFTPRGR